MGLIGWVVGMQKKQGLVTEPACIVIHLFRAAIDCRVDSNLISNQSQWTPQKTKLLTTVSLNGNAVGHSNVTDDTMSRHPRVANRRMTTWDQKVCLPICPINFLEKLNVSSEVYSTF